MSNKTFNVEDIYPNVCFQCRNSFNRCTCEELAPEDGFMYNGTLITNPFTSECGRFLVNPFLYYGKHYINFLILKNKKETT